VKLEDPFKAKTAAGKGGVEGEAVIASPDAGRAWWGIKVADRPGR
jgi:hypothetical protein